MNIYRILLFLLVVCFSTASAETFYTVRDIGTLFANKSLAKTLNSSGGIAGKYFDKDGVIFDYAWSPEKGLQVVASDAVKEVMPRINNNAQVAGILIQNKDSWLSSTRQLYFFDPSEGLKILGAPVGWDRGTMSIVDMNEKGQILLANKFNLLKATEFALWENGKFVELKVLERIVFALNNQGDILSMTRNDFLTSIFGGYYAQAFNVYTQEYVDFTGCKQCYVGIGLNDKRQVIATDLPGKQGFLGTPVEGIVSLGHFIPAGLNNQGEIVGKLQDSSGVNSAFLRRADGKMVKLDEVADFKEIQNFEGILDTFSINDKGQIGVIAKIAGNEHVLFLDPLHEAVQNEG